MCIKINKVGKQEVGIRWVQKTLPTIWGTYMKLVTKYQISVINSCWEKCDEKCAYMFNVYKNHLSQQTGSRNLTGPKTLPTIWYTYMMLVTKYQIPAINSYWEKCDEKYLGRTDRGKTVYPPPPSGSGGIIIFIFNDNVRILWLSCNIKKSKTTAKLSENNWNKRRSNRFQWCHLRHNRFFLSFYVNQVSEMLY